MQIEIHLDSPEKPIPCSYQYGVSSALYRLLFARAPEIGRKLHEGDDRSRLKLFVFSCLNSEPHPKIVNADSGNSIILGKKVWLRFASAVPEIVFHLSEALMAEGVIRIHGVDFTVKKVEMVRPPEFRPTMVYRPFGQNGMIVCRYNGKTQFPDDREKDLPGCADLLAANLRHKLLRLREMRPDILSNYLAVANLTEADIQSLPIQVEFLPLSPQKAFKVGLFSIKNTRQKAFRAPFRLTAPEPVHRIAWLCGAGSLNSQGFGLLTEGKTETAQ